MKILADASLPGLQAAFPKPFRLTLYHHAGDIPKYIEEQDVLLCRSTLKVHESLLKSSKLGYVATASSGIDHIDTAFLQKRAISLIHAKGCNAPAVADYVTACVAFLHSQCSIQGNQAGIIGMGAVGSSVYQRLQNLNFKIHTYDPLKALKDPHFKSCSIEALLTCDLICIHAELHDTEPYPSFNLFNNRLIEELKPNCILINAARGDIVNEEALLNTTNKLIYCTDVYSNEPAIDERIVDKALLCTPHIAGHSLEAKYMAVEHISRQLHEILHLPFPHYEKPLFEARTPDLKNASWHELVTSLYNPALETQALKTALDKKEAFLALRKQHNTRHDFSLYPFFCSPY